MACGCVKCIDSGDWVEVLGVMIPPSATMMVVCATCGNKRCPHSDDHENTCTGSNASGQRGSRYG